MIIGQRRKSAIDGHIDGHYDQRLVITLSIEQSATRGSVALLRDEAVLAIRTWEYTWRQTQQLFAVLPDMLAGVNIELSAVDVFAAGVGPGSFAGCRMAVSAAQALAVPGDTCVFGVSSGEALAHDMFCQTDAETVVVVGDARRQHVWLGRFARGDFWPVMTRPWSLHPADRIAEEIPVKAVVVSSEWERLSGLLKQVCPQGVLLIEEDRFPDAGVLGLLACRKILNKSSSEPLSPIYLHPAVRLD